MDVLEKEQLSRQQALCHWYYGAKYILLKAWLLSLGANLNTATLADIGCGEGLFLELIARDKVMPPEHLLGVDPALDSKHTFYDGRIHVVKQLTDDQVLQIALLMDVLEHVPDDKAVLQNTLTHCSSGAGVFITVPAFMSLWSSHDRYLGHKRRYNIRSLRELLSSVHELEVKKLYYYYAPIFPLAVLVRLWRRYAGSDGQSDLRVVPESINAILLALAHCEAKLACKNKLAGLSVVAECLKR